MTAQHLLDHFDRLIDTPDAVPRLRRFILNLAVRGKLVEQDPKDEPAGELLKRIVSEKAQLLKARKIRKQEALPAIDESEIPFELPKKWRWVRLIEVLTKLTDGTHHSPPNSETGDFKYVTAKNIKPEGVLLDAITYIDKQVHAEIFSRCDPAKGDVLYIKDGATTGIVTVNDLDEPFSMLSSVALLKLPKDIDNRLLVFFLRSPFFYDQMRGFMKGAAITRVTLKRMAPALIPLPPLAEQHRIVAKVDELMALCDELEVAQTKREKRRDRLVAATLHGLNNGDATATPGAPSTFEESARFYFNHLPRLTTRPNHIHQLRQTILNLAVRGKLVPQDQNDEVASRLLEHIRHKKCDTRKQQYVAQDKERETFYEIPKSWAWSTLGELAQDFRYGTSKKCSYVEIGRPVLRIPNVRGGRISTDDLKFTTLTESEVEDLSLVVGDILLIRSNGSLNLVGRPALVEKHAQGFCYAGYLVRVRFFSGTVAAPYLIIALNSELVRDQIEGPIRSAVGLKNINSTEFSNLAVPLPPLSEQHRIVAKFEELMVLCAGLESRITATAAIQQDFLEATIHETLS